MDRTKHRTRRVAFTAAALALAALVGTGLALDIGSFDRTRGGYAPPYTGYTGTPIDWSATDRTASGMERRGYVSTFILDCTSGLISIRILGMVVPFRVVSERAIAVHRPREACRARGFVPSF